MSCEYSANALQTVAANGSVIFTESPVPCNKGMIYHREESGLFRLASPSAMGCGYRSCCCCEMPTANYDVAFHANVQIPAGGTVGPISLAIFVDGDEDPSSTMTVTPAAVEEPFNIGSDIIVAVPWICRCSSVSVRNIGTEPVEVLNANIVFTYTGIRR